MKILIKYFLLSHILKLLGFADLNPRCHAICFYFHTLLLILTASLATLNTSDYTYVTPLKKKTQTPAKRFGKKGMVIIC